MDSLVKDIKHTIIKKLSLKDWRNLMLINKEWYWLVKPYTKVGSYQLSVPPFKQYCVLCKKIMTIQSLDLISASAICTFGHKFIVHKTHKDTNLNNKCIKCNCTLEYDFINTGKSVAYKKRKLWYENKYNLKK